MDVQEVVSRLFVGEHSWKQRERSNPMYWKLERLSGQRLVGPGRGKQELGGGRVAVFEFKGGAHGPGENGNR